MPRTLSSEAFRQMFAQEQTDTFLMCVTLEHADLPAPIRLVKNDKPITRASGTFQACYFDLPIPEDSSDGPPQVQLVIDNVNQAIARSIRTLNGRVKVTLEVVLGSQPDVVEVGPHVLWLLSSTYDARKVSGTLGFEDDILNQAFPSLTYNPENTPGIFR